jgi:hypothetical protein
MKHFYIYLFLIFPSLVQAQKEPMTAEQILDSSIAFCGTPILNKTASELTYVALLPDKSTATIDEKRIEGEKFTQCILSMTHVPQTTFFNGKNLTRVSGDSLIKIQKIKTIDEIKLRTFTNLQYGYKSLNYEITRLEDQHFNNFDCFVISAKSKNGYTTLNYFDKTNYRLLMVIYPNGNKSLMIEYQIKDGVLLNTHIINTFSNSEDQQVLKLIKYKTERIFSDLWFNCPYKDKVEIPENIKNGSFMSLNGPDTEFIRTEKSHDYFDKNGNLELRRFLMWTSTDSFGLISEQDIKNNNTSPESNILVRIISWDKDSYVCQWIAGKYTDTQDYKLKK